ncbi:alpha/beta fold hydrolase [Roseobacter sp. OBYS 0001]|uniref:alpha/beta fold hydrolase n=1 Tax=Roseobacter sp. OBYS 0001 TaxID=882651 RepID=UPI001BBD4F14|nr:alpha/beta hydrolase [Roseobacter sp. OBYS 0001]GIT86960.1 hydrolase [Roseobacter sp. OBYS 0001]
MTLHPAPYYGDIAHGPEDAAAYWVTTSDDVRIRVGHWPIHAAKGTVLIFPGRTEYIEKYGQIAKALGERGLASISVDWRGQGLADRLLDDPVIGHVDHFSDYQKDVAAMMRAARELELPRPFFLLAHSMGGAIGLRAAMEGLAVRAVVFSGPMWGIKIAPHLKPAAWVLSHTMPRIGQGHRLPPGTKMEHHVLTDGFEDNVLTRDPAQFEIMRQQLLTHPELTLGGPSYVWLREALLETRHLSSRAAPNVPCLTLMGSNERIVDISAIHTRMQSWKRGHLEIVPDAEHEVLMEGPQVTAGLFDQMVDLFLEEGGV